VTSRNASTLEGGAAAAKTPRRGALLLLSGLALASLSWALFQWRELLRMRGGAVVNCPLGDGAACAQAWDSPFAASVERVTGLPVAAWGVAWSLVALTLPLLVLLLGRRELLWSAVVVTAAAGVLAVAGLATRLVAAGAFCTSCAGSYALVLAYAGVVAFEWRRSRPLRLVPGAGLAAVAAGLALAVLLPFSRATLPPATAPLAEVPAGASAQDSLGELLRGLAPPAAQALADSLAVFRSSEPRPLLKPRTLLGSSMAPVRITDFVDMRCSHCAHLHETLAELRRIAPEGSFAIESRHFPLDGACNPMLTRAVEGSVSCVAARVLICLDADPRVFDLAGRLFAAQGALTAERVYELASRLQPRESLEACAASEATQARLLEDIEWAREHAISGTPLVLVNGRKGTPFPAFLYAMVLAGGDAQHPAFAALPPPKTVASAR
jgi:serine/threonine-protein kinase